MASELMIPNLSTLKSAPVRTATFGLMTPKAAKDAGINKVEFKKLKREYYRENRLLMAGGLASVNDGKADVKFTVRRNKAGEVTSLVYNVVPKVEDADDAAAQLAEMQKKLDALAAENAAAKAKLAELGIE